LDDCGERKKKKKNKKNEKSMEQGTDKSGTNKDQLLAERYLGEFGQNAKLTGQASLFADPPLFELICSESRIGRAPCGNGCRGNSLLFM
jgi:hypothetical protein